jgi:hypothetical protein
MRRLSNAAILMGSLLTVRTVFSINRRANPRFQAALSATDSTFRFRMGEAAVQLVISDGRVRVRPGAGRRADFELRLLDPKGVVKQMVKEPDNVLPLLIEARIEQSGNPARLFHLGYLASLCSVQLGELNLA